jgi:ABC-type Fe3+-citrate transport system substrate-binding protein
MSIAIQVLGRNDPGALAELIAATIQDGVVLDREPQVAHLSALVDAEEREAVRRRATWHWLNSISNGTVDRDNDWSEI